MFAASQGKVIFRFSSLPLKTFALRRNVAQREKGKCLRNFWVDQMLWSIFTPSLSLGLVFITKNKEKRAFLKESIKKDLHREKEERKDEKNVHKGLLIKFKT